MLLQAEQVQEDVHLSYSKERLAHLSHQYIHQSVKSSPNHVRYFGYDFIQRLVAESESFIQLHHGVLSGCSQAADGILLVPYRLVMRYFLEHGEFPSERVLLATLAAYHAQPELFSRAIELPTIIGTVKFNQLLELPEEGEAPKRYAGQDVFVINDEPPVVTEPSVPKKPKVAPKAAPKPLLKPVDLSSGEEESSSEEEMAVKESKAKKRKSEATEAKKDKEPPFSKTCIWACSFCRSSDALAVEVADKRLVTPLRPGDLKGHFNKLHPTTASVTVQAFCFEHDDSFHGSEQNVEIKELSTGLHLQTQEKIEIHRVLSSFTMRERTPVESC